jgi:hypothetical protein
MNALRNLGRKRRHRLAAVDRRDPRRRQPAAHGAAAMIEAAFQRQLLIG